MNIFITVWNRFSWLIPFCEDCKKAGLTPVLIDNNSTYEPCIEWLKSCGHEVIYNDKNIGPWVFFVSDLYTQYTDKYFFISDSDQDISGVPLDWPQHLISGLERHRENKIWKAGLSQEINDIPLNNSVSKKIYDYEKGFWKNKMNDGFYHVAMDLGVAVYDRSRRTNNPTNTDENGHNWYNAIRSDRPYTSRHLDWYMSEETMRPEDVYYYTNKEKTHYGWGHKYYDEVYLNNKK